MESHSGGAGNHPGRFRFGDIEVDPASHGVTRAGEPRQLEPKAYAVLLVLLERPGELVPRDELLDQVWGHRHVTPGVLTRAIAQLRAVLGDDHHHPRYIQTRHALGYSFIGELEPPATDDRPEHHAGPPPPDADPAADGPAGVDAGQAAGPAAAPAVPAAGGDDDDGRPLRLGRPALVIAAVLLVAVMLWGGDRDGPARPAEASIAVMPFVNLGNQRDKDYFAEGLAVEMHDALAGIEGLKVAAPVSPAVAHGLEPDVRKIGALLGVATVLNASVRHDGNRVRITARLSDCATGFTLWSETYDRDLSDIFDTQAEISGEVVAALLGAMPQHRELLAGRLGPTRSAAAFDAYLRGLQQLRLAAGDGGGVENAIGWFDQAMKEDGQFVRAQAGICRSRLVRFNDVRNAQAFKDAETACALARDMAPGSAEVDLAFGDLHRASGDYEQAISNYAKARRDPARAPAALAGLGRLHAARGEHERAAAYFGEALALSPGSGVIHGRLGVEHYLAGNLQASIESFRRSVELRPDDAVLWSSLGGVYLAAGENKEAETAFERSLSIRPTAAVLTNYAELQSQQGDLRAAVTLLRRALELDASDPLIWGGLGDALLADPVTAPQARDAYAQAARIAGDYLEINRGDATMTAAHGWYLANLGERARALERVQRSAGLGAGRAEVAVFNAQTMAAVGDLPAALHWLEVARDSGVPESRIRATPLLARIVEAGQADGTGNTGVDDTARGGRALNGRR